MIQENVRILLVEDDGDDYVITKSLLSEIKGQQIHLDWAKNFDTALGLMTSMTLIWLIITSERAMASNCCAWLSNEVASRPSYF